jgi:hypothetical protein
VPVPTNLLCQSWLSLFASAIFVVQLNRQAGDAITTPDRGLNVQAGDGLVIVSRNGQAARAMFEAPPEKVRAGRATF